MHPKKLSKLISCPARATYAGESSRSRTPPDHQGDADVAAAKMRKAQQAALVGRPYAQLLNEIMAEAATRTVGFDHPLMQSRPVARRAVVLVGTDRGLCGGLNSNLFREASKLTRTRRCLSRRERKPRNLFRAQNGICRRNFLTKTRRNSPRRARFQNSRSRCF